MLWIPLEMGPCISLESSYSNDYVMDMHQACQRSSLSMFTCTPIRWKLLQISLLIYYVLPIYMQTKNLEMQEKHMDKAFWLYHLYFSHMRWEHIFRSWVKKESFLTFSSPTAKHSAGLDELKSAVRTLSFISISQ